MAVITVGASPYLMQSVKRHKHDYCEIILNLEGEGAIAVEGREYPFYPGHIICLPAGAEHFKSSKRGFKDIYISATDFPFLSGKIYTLTDDEQGSISSLMKMAYSIFIKKERNYISVVNALYEAVKQMLLSRAGTPPMAGDVEVFKDILAKNLNNPEFSIGDALSGTGYCTDHFRRKFKRETGLTPSQYLMRIRLEYAEHLLKTTDEPIGDVALLCGFYDQKYFSRLIKQKTGQPPGRLKNSFKSENT